MIDISQAMLDPSSVFNNPEDVVASAELTDEEKIMILHRWEYDEREILVAAEENMAGEESDLLDRVLRALHQLGVGTDTEHGSPTKHGGE